jgi:putative tricarboxylic transport membrane protein
LKKNVEIMALGVLSLILIGLIWESFRFEPTDLGAGIGPAFWVRIIIGLALFLIAFQIYSLRTKENLSSGGGASRKEPAIKIWIRFLLVIGYVVAIPLLGFFWASPLFLVIAITYFGQKGLIQNLLVSLALTFVLLVIYISLLYVPLPKGVGFFEDASNLLMRIFMVR